LSKFVEGLYQNRRKATETEDHKSVNKVKKFDLKDIAKPFA
jgi:hypothetical protein